MRRLVLAAACAAAAAAAPAHAALPNVSDYVTVELQGPVNCVTDPCPQPTPVVVCVVATGTCTPE